MHIFSKQWLSIYALSETGSVGIKRQHSDSSISGKMGFPGGSDGEESACNVWPWGLIPGLGRFPVEMATHARTLAWKLPWTEESGCLQSMGSQRIGHDWATNTLTFTSSEKMKHAWGQSVREQCYKHSDPARLESLWKPGGEGSYPGFGCEGAGEVHSDFTHKLLTF